MTTAKMNLVRFSLKPEIKLPVDLTGDRNATARLRRAAVVSAERNIAMKVGMFLVVNLLQDSEIQVPGAIRKEIVFDLLLTDAQVARFPDSPIFKSVLVDDDATPAAAVVQP